MDRALQCVVALYVGIMDTDEISWFGGLSGAAPVEQNDRTCSSCGSDCWPIAIATGDKGVRFAFTCAKHGLQSIIDPFANSR